MRWQQHKSEMGRSNSWGGTLTLWRDRDTCSVPTKYCVGFPGCSEIVLIPNNMFDIILFPLTQKQNVIKKGLTVLQRAANIFVNSLNKEWTSGVEQCWLGLDWEHWQQWKFELLKRCQKNLGWLRGSPVRLSLKESLRRIDDEREQPTRSQSITWFQEKKVSGYNFYK